MHKMRVIYGCKFFRCQIKIVILPGSCNKAYWEQSFSGNWDRDSAIVLQKADKGLNSSQAQTWAKGSIIVLLQVPASAAREKKSIQGGHKEQWKSWSLSNAALVLQNIPLHKRVNKDSVDFSFLLGEVPALSNNLIIHRSLQGKQSGPWKEGQTKEKLSAGLPKDTLWALWHQTSPAHRCYTNSITPRSASVKPHSAWLRNAITSIFYYENSHTFMGLKLAYIQGFIISTLSKCFS